MPSINLEMMKQLLEEFSEKEALTTEEIKVIEKEIGSLEQRAGFCRNRLQSLGADKEKLAAMKERYISGKFPAPSKPAKIAEQATDQTIPDSAIEPESPAKKEPTQVDIKALTPQAETTEMPVIKSEPSKKKEAANKSEKTSNEEDKDQEKEDSDTNKENSEPIKSINDALKGLFRK